MRGGGAPPLREAIVRGDGEPARIALKDTFTASCDLSAGVEASPVGEGIETAIGAVRGQVGALKR
eukprot:6157334-Pyramimonas_sp.AAC.1